MSLYNGKDLFETLINVDLNGFQSPLGSDARDMLSEQSISLQPVSQCPLRVARLIRHRPKAPAALKGTESEPRSGQQPNRLTTGSQQRLNKVRIEPEAFGDDAPVSRHREKIFEDHPEPLVATA